MNRLDLPSDSLPADLRRLLLDSDRSMDAEDPAMKLRLLDRAWRQYPSHAAAIAARYARQLLRDGGDRVAAFHMSERAVALAPSTQSYAVLIESLLALGEVATAQTQCALALTRQAIDFNDPLARAATTLSTTEVPGWIGISADGYLIGYLHASTRPLEMRIDGSVIAANRIRFKADGTSQRFSVRLHAHELAKTFEANAQGVSLLGSGLCLPADFGLECAIVDDGQGIHGWVRFNWAPTHKLQLKITDEHGHSHWVRRAVTHDSGQQAFVIKRAHTRLKGHRWQLAAKNPAHTLSPLPGSPFLWPTAAKEGLHSPQGRAPTRTPTAPVAIDVIVPVYEGLEETMACLRTVLATLPRHARVLVIDDATPNRALARHLDQLAASDQIELIRHTENKGFVASVNAALTRHPTHDVVLLNADTQVFGHWLSRLKQAAYAEARIGTVTPWSNQGSVASYPGVADPTVTAAQAEALDALASQSLKGQRAEIPVGVGFCLYIRRDCLNATGLLNESVFGRGYGEETDFCMRARARGYRHRLAADVFVYHIGSRSFGAKRTALLARSQRLVNLRHPGYDRSIQRFEAQDPFAPLRRTLDEKRMALDPKPAVLLISHALQGGVERVVQTRTLVLQAEGFQVLILRPARAGDRRRVRLTVVGLEASDLVYEWPHEQKRLLTLLKTRRLDHLEVHHFLQLDPRLMDQLLTLNAPVDVQIHDYAWLCPQITLIDASGRYCGEQGLAACRACVKKIGSEIGERLSVPALRERSTRWLARARHIKVPTHDTQVRYQRYFPKSSFQVEALGATPPSGSPPPFPASRLKVRVALVGAIGAYKGYEVLLQCARDAAKRDLPLEFVVVGFTQADAALERTGRVFITGAYREGEALPLLQREAPDVVFLASVSPETWCYALDPALESGLPVVAFDIGAIRERLHGRPQGYLLSLSLSAASINDALVARARPSAHPPMSSHRRYPLSTAIDIPTMPMPTDTHGLSASVQLLPLPEGLYVFSVESGTPRTHHAGGTLTLPAIHVSTGPGVAPGDAEFLAKAEDLGGWLFAPGDFLVVRLKAVQASLLITTIRDAAGSVLTIKVERLDSRFEEQTSSARARPAVLPPTVPSAPTGLNLEISAHVRNHGDLVFERAPWAGRVGPGLWLESFAITPLEGLAATDIEYKGLTSSGFETPWIPGGKPCGTKQLGVPLVGFAVRLKPSAKTAAYDCTYSGYFQSSAQVGPLHNGAPCRSSVANDPLEGIQLQITKRTAKKESSATQRALAPAKKPLRTPAKSAKTAKPVNPTKKKKR